MFSPRVLAFSIIALHLSFASFAQADNPSKTDAKPAWAGEAIFYQIFPDRFRNGDPRNDPPREYLESPIAAGDDWKISSWTTDWYSRAEWEKGLGDNFYRDGVFERRYGGDLQGVIDKLDYLADLGINAIYFNPLFASHSLHKYDGNSYHHIDPYFGPDPEGDLKLIARESADPESWNWTAADKLFLELVKKCHERKMHVIIDGVFNHTGRDFFAFRNIREKQAESPYRSWYVIDSFDNPETKRNEFSYKGWWGHATLPVFAATSDGQDMHPGPKQYIFEATRRWMQPHGTAKDGIDGWRLDVAEERPSKFWADWNALVRKLNPNAYTTAEIWKDAASLVREGGFSASMNYNAFTIPVKGFLIDNNISPSEFVKLLNSRREAFPPPVAAVMQNLMDSHDTDRLASMIVNGEGTVYKKAGEIDFNENNDAHSSETYEIRKPNERERQIQRMVVMFQMCYLGAPMIYYGDEAGMWGGHDPDDRMPMVWADMTFEPQAIDPRGKERSADENNFDVDLFNYYKEVVHLRQNHDALNHGEFRAVKAMDDQHTLVVERRAAKEAIVSAYNRGDDEVSIDLPSAGLKTLLVSSGDPQTVKVTSSPEGSHVTLPALTSAAFLVEP